MEDSQQNVQEATALPVPQPPAEQPPEREASVLLKRSVFVMLIVGIVVALLVGYGIGRLTTISRDNVVIAQKNSKIEKLNTSLQSVKKQLADATASSDSIEDSSDDSGDNSEDKPQQGQIGQTVDNGGIEMKLISASEQSTINYDTCGDGCSNGSYAPKSPDANTKYWVAVVEVKNNTKQPLDITCGYPYEIKALNSDNQQYTPIENLYQVQGNPECNVSLQPGLSAQVTYPFQVPLDAKMVALAFRDVGDLLSGTGGQEEYSYLIADQGYEVTAGE
ncbi:DUF4352 domain-containing protein [Bifidobacterium boum]|uniref:hypothetical protein n=1 Tax=Bifidobacterium boum TaxID=78343 RepID=UPI001F3C4F6F|nr:hypothetical protein [Bifidobacterium boum]MCF2561021.1 DUF4352 domain-containing protein [Bifidobacterium boum]